MDPVEEFAILRHQIRVLQEREAYLHAKLFSTATPTPSPAFQSKAYSDPSSTEDVKASLLVLQPVSDMAEVTSMIASAK